MYSRSRLEGVPALGQQEHLLGRLDRSTGGTTAGSFRPTRAFSRTMPSICRCSLPRCSLKAGRTRHTVCRLPSTSTMSPTSMPRRCMSAGSIRAMPRPTSLPVDSLTRRVISSTWRSHRGSEICDRAVMRLATHLLAVETDLQNAVVHSQCMLFLARSCSGSVTSLR